MVLSTPLLPPPLKSVHKSDETDLCTNSVADPSFPGRGPPTPGGAQTYYFVKFLPKIT